MKPHSLENLVTHQAQKIWLRRHRTSERTSVQILGEGEGSLKFNIYENFEERKLSSTCYRSD